MRSDHSQTRTQTLGITFGLLSLILVLGMRSNSVMAAGTPTLWGYGVKTCPNFVAAAPPDGVSNNLAGDDFPRYREWLAGLVTGLNLATGTDVLRGAELDAALTRIRAYCKDHPRDDFFNASLSLFKSLGQNE